MFNTREKPIVKATHGNENRPLNIAGILIPCFVLANGRRVLVQRSMANAIGISDTGGQRITLFAGGKFLSDSVSKDLIDKLINPIIFKTPQGAVAHGYDASILVDLCDSVLAARRAGRLLQHHKSIADRCEILVRGFAKTGIYALIDEATGYQHKRSDSALHKILEAFIDKELQPWLNTFPEEYYTQLARLRGIDLGVRNPPRYFGHLTNNIVYKRLAPGVLEELKEETPRSIKGNTKARYFQHLTTNIGYPKLREHLASVITLMKISTNYDGFIRLLDQCYPKLK